MSELERKEEALDEDRSRRHDRSRDRSRSRDRRRRRSRSRSRSRERRKKKKSRRSRRSDSRSRSPERKKKKKKGGWDVKPEDIPGGVPGPTGYGLMQGGQHGMMGRPHVDPKKARTAYVGGLSPGCGISADLIRAFFEEQLPRVNDRPAYRGRAVESVAMNSNGVYGFVEFYNSFDADIAMCMDGMKLNGVQLQIRRPRNFTPDPNTKKYTIPGLVSSQVPDGPHKIFLGGLPNHLMDAEVQAIAASFGQLEAFSLVKERDSMISKGYAFFSYIDRNLTNVVCAALNGKEIQGKIVACKPANQKNPIGALPTAASNMGVMGNAAAVLGMRGPMNGPLTPPSPFLKMTNMVTPQELADDAEYKDILEDVRDECSNYGQLIHLSIPRPPHPQCGTIFLHYGGVEQAVAARNALSGRTFAERLIAVNFIQQHEMVG